MVCCDWWVYSNNNKLKGGRIKHQMKHAARRVCYLKFIPIFLLRINSTKYLIFKLWLLWFWWTKYTFRQQWRTYLSKPSLFYRKETQKVLVSSINEMTFKNFLTTLATILDVAFWRLVLLAVFFFCCNKKTQRL